MEEHTKSKRSPFRKKKKKTQDRSPSPIKKVLKLPLKTKKSKKKSSRSHVLPCFGSGEEGEPVDEALEK
jgi:hypothetical protein